MSDVLGIDLSEDRLLAIAADCIEEHNFIGALRMLNKNAQLNGNAEDAYMMYAETFDDMRIFDKCINGWFKYIDYVASYDDVPDLSDAYEGLAVSFMNMGRESFAAFYYNKLLLETDEQLSPEARQEIIDDFLASDEPPLKFAYPPRLADFSDEIDNGLKRMRENDYDGAVGEFEKVDEGNGDHVRARNYIAMCNIICDKCDEAEQECLRILDKYPDDIQALTTLAAVKNQQNKSEESLALTRRLLSLPAEKTDDIYKIATVCCENNLHDEAYKLFCKLEEELMYDCNVLYFKAVSAYNSGRWDKSMDAFDRLLTIYPDAMTAKYYYDYVRAHREGDDYLGNPLTYFYRLPDEQREANIQLLTAFSRLKEGDAVKLAQEIDITDCIRWCFDEGDGGGKTELQTVGALCAVRARCCDDLLRDILLDASLSDTLKMQLIHAIAERNEGDVYGVVVCNIYKRVEIPVLEIGRTKKKAFVRAYAALIARFALIDADYAYRINDAAVKLYDTLADREKLGDVKEHNALVAAIFHLSGIHEGDIDDATICAFFGAKQQNYDLLLGKNA